jgi:predicted GH43/DUF377 family glycosyl hydrolase
MVKEKLGIVGLKNVEEKYPADLSGGMRKRVGLARAIVLGPKIVLYDEPTTGLDPITTDYVDEMILDAKKPWIVKHTTKHPILFPEAEYEMRGLVEHVCFPCSKIIEDNGEVKLYYGGADTVQCLATAKLKDIVHACKHW